MASDSTNFAGDDYRGQLSRFLIAEQTKENSAYQRNLIGIRVRALSSCYPFCEASMGRRTFHALALSYAQHYPSVHWDINLYGEMFSEFTAAQLNGPRPEQTPWRKLSELATVEYGINRCYYNGNTAKANFNLVITHLERPELEKISQYHPVLLDTNESCRNPYQVTVFKKAFRIYISLAPLSP